MKPIPEVLVKSELTVQNYSLMITNVAVSDPEES